MIPCDQEGCTSEAVCAFTWPGRRELASCKRHALAAKKIAEHMGFVLRLDPLEQLIANRASETVEALGQKWVTLLDLDFTAEHNPKRDPWVR